MSNSSAKAWLGGYWDEAVSLARGLFNSTFKTNEYLYRGIITGITRISKESIFSDLNNLEVVTTTSDKYETAFGFTEKEVFDALDYSELGAEKQRVKHWYDGYGVFLGDNIWYTLAITNTETKYMFRQMIEGWFAYDGAEQAYNSFVKSLLMNDVEYMNEFMNKVALHSFSSFDTAKNVSDDDALERFYHGFVLGLFFFEKIQFSLP